MKKARWWILGLLLSPVLLTLVLALLLYLPPVQHWMVGRMAKAASEATGFTVTVDRVRLAFPLNLGVGGVQVIGTDSVTGKPDTLASVERTIVDVQLWPLLEGRVVVNGLEVNHARIHTAGLIAAARVKGEIGRLRLASRGIDLVHQTLQLNGALLEDCRLDIALNDSVPEDTTTTENHWRIMADSIVVRRTSLVLHTPGDTMQVRAGLGRLRVRQADLNLGAQTYKVAAVDWEQGTLRYDNHFEPMTDGLDANHLSLDGIRLGLDSLYFHDTTIRLSSLRVQTPSSDVRLKLELPLSLMDEGSKEQMRLQLDAQLGRQDLMRFMGAMPQDFQRRWPYYPLSVSGSLSGNLTYMDVADLCLSLPTVCYAKAEGFVAHVSRPELLRTKLDFQVETGNLSLLTGLLPKDLQRNFHIPHSITARGQVAADGTHYTADVTLREGQGTVKANGSLDTQRMAYAADVQVNRLNLHHFMPHDSIYRVSASAHMKGQGTDLFSPHTVAQADVQLDALDYGAQTIDGVQATLDLRKGVLHAAVDSRSPLATGLVTLDALMSKQRLQATLATDLQHLDLCRLQLVEKPLTVGLCGHIDVTSNLQNTHYVNGTFNDLTIRDSVRVYRPRDITLFANLKPDTTEARLECGDFLVQLNAAGSYGQLAQSLTQVSDSVLAQMEHKIINQSAIRRLLPVMRLHVASQSDNPVANLLRIGMDVSYKDLHFDVETAPGVGINGDGYIHALVYDGMRLDTVSLKLLQYKEQLAFHGQIRNNRRNPQFVFNTVFNGVVQERGASIGLRYYDDKDRLGVRIGAKAEMVDSGISIRLLPDRPTLGYKEFSLNPDNYIFLGADNRVKAHVNLVADDGTGVKVYSTDSDPEALQDITVSMNRFNLAGLTAVLPYAPRLGGLMEGDCHVVQHPSGHFSVVGNVAVSDMTYEGCRWGNIGTELIYLQKEDDAHAVEARLMKDDEEVGVLSGTYYNAGDGSLDAVLQLERLPLSLVNGFVPNQIAGLEGSADGQLTIKGALASPQVNGELMLENSWLVSVPYGLRLRFDDDPVRIVDSKLLLENFNVYAYNDNPLTVMGYVNFADPAHTTVDMRMRAANCQIINAKENARSEAYGKVFVNFMGRMNGDLDNLTMRGKLDVLGTTDMRYILRDSPLSTDNQLDELVKFTDFSDTLQTVVSRPDLTGFNMNLTMEVSQGAHIIAYLNADHSNYVDLTGGGTLRMTYSPADNMQLTGKYTLSNGEMKYSLPVIPLKTFVIQDGSYIEFTGDMMNPTLNITATEQTKATVTGSNGVGRSVEFDCGVVITRTLNNMGLEFTLDAPEDMQLHSELQAMGVERRGKLAVSMLTTGMYLSEGNTGAFSMNSALSSFLNAEINQITGNALRTLDLSFGLDNATDASGNMHTDYSFKFAKRFWNNRLKVSVGGKVSSGSDYQRAAESVFDNVTLEYRLDDTANKYLTFFYDNNAYDWLDGYTQKYGAGFVWRRTLQNFGDLIRFRSGRTPLVAPRQPRGDSLRVDSVRVGTVKP